MFGSGLQVDRRSSSNTRNVYVPPVTQGKGRYFSGYPHRPPPFLGIWEDMEKKGPLGMGVAAKGGAVKSKKKKKPKGKGLLLGKNSPFNSIPILGDIL